MLLPVVAEPGVSQSNRGHLRSHTIQKSLVSLTVYLA